MKKYNMVTVIFMITVLAVDYPLLHTPFVLYFQHAIYTHCFWISFGCTSRLLYLGYLVSSLMLYANLQ